MRSVEIEKLYRHDDKKTYHIDIALDYYRDIYSDWDFAPFKNRDLDDDLIDFMMDCSYEIPMKYKLQVDFFLPREMEDALREKRSIQGFRNYFKYALRKKRRSRHSLLARTLMYFFAGAAFLAGAYLLQGVLDNTFLTEMVREGMFIGAWVFIWEICTILFFQLADINKWVRHLKRLADVQIKYHYLDNNRGDGHVQRTVSQ